MGRNTGRNYGRSDSMAQRIVPNLWFDNQAESAASFYVASFPNSRIVNMVRYGEESAKASGMKKDMVMTVEFELAGNGFIALNGGPAFSFTPSISFSVACENADEVDHLFGRLSGGGKILMPLDTYSFSQKYAWIEDRFGLSWQLYFGHGRQKITPCLTFGGQLYGKASEAMDFYEKVFGSSRVENVSFLGQEKSKVPKALKRAEFSLDGYWIATMDSEMGPAFSFTPAVSFMVNCFNQEEIDHFWKSLSAVSEAEQCGWLKDRFGISWQIVPSVMQEIMRENDRGKIDMVMKSVLNMKKLRIEEIIDAYNGNQPVRHI